MNKYIFREHIADPTVQKEFKQLVLIYCQYTQNNPVLLPSMCIHCLAMSPSGMTIAREDVY